MVHHSQLALGGEKNAVMINVAEKHFMIQSIYAIVFIVGRIGLSQHHQFVQKDVLMP